MTIIRRLAAVGVVAAVLLGTTACLQLPHTSTDPTAKSASKPDTTTKGDSAPDPSPSATPPSNLAFGQVATYTDGVSISVSQPVPFTPDQYAAGVVPNMQNILFNITVTNGSKSNLNPSIYTTASAGGQEGSQIFDTANHLGLTPDTALLPGQTVTFPVGFSLASADGIVLQTAPSYSYAQSIFTNVK